MWKQPPEKFCRKAIVKTSQYSHENACVGVSFNFRILRTAASENVHKTEKN